MFKDKVLFTLFCVAFKPAAFSLLFEWTEKRFFHDLARGKVCTSLESIKVLHFRVQSHT